MLITFSGLDGSGKSTLIECVREALERDNRRVIVCHMYYDTGLMGTVRRMFERTIVGNTERTQSRADRLQSQAQKNILKRTVIRYKRQLIWNKTLRLLLYPIDVCFFLWYRFHVETLGKQVLIMDRYFYDTLADVTENHKSNRGRLLTKLAPKPDLPIYLEISPETAFARKADRPINKLDLRWRSYQKLLDWMPDLVVVFTDQDPETTRHCVTRIINERLVASR